MNLEQDLSQINPRYEEWLRLRNSWVWFLILGIVLIAAGTLAIAAAFIATLTSVLLFGILLLAGGVVQLINAFLARTWNGFVLHLFAGLVYLVIGALMIDHPVRAAEGLTLMLATAFLVGGAVRVIYALIHSFAGRSWVVINGFISLLLGIAIWRQWPESSLWVIGLFIGVDLIVNGWMWVMVGIMVKAPVAGPGPSEIRGPSPALPATN
jgi:uncharacterized membrane protein HdeD (DUF308 family)